MPCRLADVRTGTGMQRLDATIVRVPVVGQCGVPTDATAVALTVTVDATGTGAGGYVSIWPEGLEPVTASVVNHWGREVRANGAIVGLEAPGTLAVLSSTGAPVVLDVTGWFVPATSSAAGRFVPIAPTRAIDTREAPRRAPLAAGETVTVPLPSGVPADAAAVAITVTTTQSPGPGFLSVAPGGAGRPPSSALNTDARNQTRAAGAIVGVTPAGIDVYSLTGGHVIVDVTGWFTGATAATGTDGLFVAERTPRRLLDTRRGDPIWAGGGTEIPNVAPNAAALVLNVAIVQPRAPGYVTAHPARQAVPGDEHGQRPHHRRGRRRAGDRAHVDRRGRAVLVERRRRGGRRVRLVHRHTGAGTRRAAHERAAPRVRRGHRPGGADQLLRQRCGVHGLRLPAPCRPPRRPRAVALPGRLRPRARQPVDVRAQRRPGAERGVLHRAVLRHLRVTRRVPVRRCDAAAAPLVLADGRRGRCRRQVPRVRRRDARERPGVPHEDRAARHVDRHDRPRHDAGGRPPPGGEQLQLAVRLLRRVRRRRTPTYTRTATVSSVGAPSRS